MVHKYVLHGLGRKKESFFAFHWHEHHKRARKDAMRDEDYERSPFGQHAQGKEVLMLVASSAAAAVLVAPRFPWFTATAIYGAWNYYRCHKKAHLDPEWARKHVPWHFDHHMGPDQDANWCVTRPWFDYLMGTRVVSSPELMESNPLGIKLPTFVEKRVNAAARRLLPRAFARLDENRVLEASARARGLDQAIPEVGQAA